ncbi:MAG: phosphoribosylaminoimidazolesuccinocarboxamide synthase [Isosphaeraceae bacterium]
MVDLEDGRLLIVATDRISAFDWVLHDPIPDKGRVLNGLSAFWFDRLGVANHMISTNPLDAGLEIPEALREELVGRSMIVRKARVVPFECVVRGYLAGSGWKEYRTRGTVCGETLAPGLVESDRIEPPVFTPATKAETGHDENVAFESMANAIGLEMANTLREKSLAVYQNAAEYARKRGLILADTKFEWGIAEDDGELLLIDEALTPDSSRYWPLDGYRPGGPQPSFDKQFVRDWLETSGWDKSSEPPKLPEEVVGKTREKYIQAYEILTEKKFFWR